jgi:hypothetical protein
VDASNGWVGSVWSLREGRVLIGRLLGVRERMATLAVVGLGPVLPEGVRLLPVDAGGGPVVEVPLPLLLGRWKRLGGVRPPAVPASPTGADAARPRSAA